MTESDSPDWATNRIVDLPSGTVPTTAATKPTPGTNSISPDSTRPNARATAAVNSLDPHSRRVWESVSYAPLRSLWDLQGVPVHVVLRRTATSFMDDNLLSRSAELGYYFLFALFPTLICISAILGLFVRSVGDTYINLLNYLSLVVPPDALAIVLDTFKKTTEHSSGGKVTFGLAAALWSASVGFSAIQDTLNTVYKVKETRPYWKARGASILVTLLLAVIAMAILASLLAGTLLSHLVRSHVWHPRLGLAYGIGLHLIFDGIGLALNLLLFATIYYYAPALKNKKWRYLTPGAAVGVAGWLLSSVLLRVYLHFFNNYSVTYGSLGAVIVLLIWFYLTGLMLLTGAEINSEIEGAATEQRLKQQGQIPRSARTSG